ncbi:MAG TPA: sulfite reductase subunit beta (hemoprotein) [Bacteroidales bacterium]|nr:MAG: hypothetical protein A2X06_15085 [Bacteroidetes bacterium GWC2_40_22]HBH85515.1 sulfite reductase subunit beta (hemoprotein) [Bacteroidales bacterium]
MYSLPDNLTEEIENYEALISDFLDKKIEPAKFKATRVPMGIYEQRKDGTFMVRVRCAGGYISPSQLEQVASIAKKYGSELLHITTRQEIQIQNITLQNTVNILKDLYQIGLASRGGGGNTVRNIMASVDSGIDPNETFDVFPYTVALTNKLIAEADSWTLPRKFKIAFSNTEEDTAYSTFNDLGFIAKEKDGVKGFKVFIGGSLGLKPMVSPVLFEFIPSGEIGLVADAAKKLFSRYGNRKNKHKARLRYVFYKLGKGNVFNLYQQIYNELKNAGNNQIIIPDIKSTTNLPDLKPQDVIGSEFDLWRKRYVKTQKQDGFYSIIVPFIFGNVPADIAHSLGEYLRQFGNDVIRFSMRQNIHLRNIPEQYLGNIYNFLLKTGINTGEPLLLNTMASCTGADTCRLGICLSRGALNGLRKELAKSKLALDELGDIKINISGCPNSCGQQASADLGFYGIVGRNDRMYPAYEIVAGAVQSEYNAKLAEQVGKISARDLPEFTVKLLEKYLSKKINYKNFSSYIASEGKKNITDLCSKFNNIPDFEEDKNYYFDWGSENIFSLVGRGLGECSAGLFDLIDLDMNSIINNKEKILQTSDRAAINEYLYAIIYSSSRMLLITKGIEPKNDQELFDAFINNFIDEGLINQEYKYLVKKTKQNPNDNLIPDKDNIYLLSDAVIELYENMDDSLHFKTEAAKPVTVDKKAEVVKIKDFRGIKCPLNFVKTKIELSALKSGDLLEILLDDGEPIENVPGSVKSEGHNIIKQDRIDNYWSVLIQKN